MPSKLVQGIHYQDYQLESDLNLKVHHWSRESAQKDPVILCVQGLGGHGLYYQFLANELVLKGLQVISFDLRGHGHSEGIRGDIQSFYEYVEDVASVVQWVKDSIHPTQLHILGESMGASISINYLVQHQPSIDSLMLVAPVLQPTVSFEMKEVFKFLFWAVINRKKPIMNLRGREEEGCRQDFFNDYTRNDDLFISHASIRFLWLINGFIKKALKNSKKLKDPVIVFQGGQDRVTGYQGLKKSFERFVQKKEWFFLEEAFHCVLHDPETPVVEKKILKWVQSFS